MTGLIVVSILETELVDIVEEAAHAVLEDVGDVGAPEVALAGNILYRQMGIQIATICGRSFGPWDVLQMQ